MENIKMKSKSNLKSKNDFTWNKISENKIKTNSEFIQNEKNVIQKTCNSFFPSEIK